MAPRRSSSSGSSSSDSGFSSNACAGAFSDSVYSIYAWVNIAYFVSYCLFFVFYFGLAVCLCCVAKRNTSAKRLVGPIYVVSIVFSIIYWALLIIGTMLRECRTTTYYSYYDWFLAAGIFSALSSYFLLIVVVWSVNMLLREHLGSGRGIYKVICLVMLIIMAPLTCGLIGLRSYNRWTVTPEGQDADADHKGDQESQLSLAYWILYMIFSLAAGAMAIVTLVSMRSRKIVVGGALTWTIALTFCMFVSNLIIVIEWGASQPSNAERVILSIRAYVALDYIVDFFTLFSYICVLFIAKSRVWDSSVSQATPQNGYQYGPPPPQQQVWNGQQYAYQGQPGQQPYYHNQPAHTVPEMGQGLPHEVK